MIADDSITVIGSPKRAMRRRGALPPLVVTPQTAATRPNAAVWVPILREFPAAREIEVTLAQAVVEFPDATLAHYAELIGRSTATVSRIMSKPDWQKLYRAFVLSSKGLLGKKLRACLSLSVDRTLRTMRNNPKYQPDRDEQAILALAGKVAGEIGPEVQTTVQTTVDVDMDSLFRQAVASIAEAGQQPNLLQTSEGR